MVPPVLRVAIISHSESYYSTRRLLEAGTTLGYAMSRVDPIRVVLAARVVPVGAARPAALALVEEGRELPVPDVVVPRIGTTLAAWSLGLLEAWRIAGARSALTPAAIQRAGDKLAATLRFAERGIPFVPTVAVRESGHAGLALQLLGEAAYKGPSGPGSSGAAEAAPGDAWVMKPAVGTGGDGVCLTVGEASARSVLGALTAKHAVVLVQPFVPLTPARDYRVLIAGGEVLAACMREAAPGEFRANIHQGARAHAVSGGRLPEGAAELALKAAQAVGLPFAGVDLIETPSGLAVLEVNASPGFQGIEAATGRDLATPFLQRFVAWDEG